MVHNRKSYIHYQFAITIFGKCSALMQHMCHSKPCQPQFGAVPIYVKDVGVNG